MEEKRNISIDILRATGILLIILAHTVTSSEVITQLRSFDVPLMVFVSGILSINSYKKEKNYFSYLKKRIVRLLVPTYVFLIVFFGMSAIVYSISNVDYPFTIKKIINTFLLLDGIGYVWIIRVYLLMAVITPLVIKMKEKMNQYVFMTLLVVLYVIYELIYMMFGNANLLLTYVFYYIIPYACVLSLGMGANKEENKKKNIVIIICSAVTFFISAFIVNLNQTDFVYTYLYKYPPRIYYLSYAILMSFLALEITRKLKIKNEIIYNGISFVGKHSMWIYLWHILYLFIIDWTMPTINEFAKFLLIVVFSVVTTYLQNKIVDTKKDCKMLNFLRG